MLLNNVTWVETGETVNIGMENGLIKSIGKDVAATNHLTLNFENAIAFPGLINSHDHLDFNLFPQLGDRVYDNYTEWGKHIHEHYKTEINAVLKIPVELRECWGMAKNLLGGVTTVVNHGQPVQAKQRLINVFENYYFIHSVQFEKKWKLKLNNPLKREFPVVMHVGEGTDGAAHSEIDQLIKSNYLHKKLIGVHGAAITEDQAKKFEALVWCPESNYFLLNKTANVERLKDSTTILFGTDSTLTGNWNIWDHIKLARKTGMLSDEELYNALTKNASRVWKLNNIGLQSGNAGNLEKRAPARAIPLLRGVEGCVSRAHNTPPQPHLPTRPLSRGEFNLPSNCFKHSKLQSGQNADLVIAKKKSDNALDSFFAVEPEDILLVTVKDDIKLFDESLRAQLPESHLARYSAVSLGESTKYIKTDIAPLIDGIKHYYPQAQFPFGLTNTTANV